MIVEVVDPEERKRCISPGAKAKVLQQAKAVAAGISRPSPQDEQPPEPEGFQEGKAYLVHQIESYSESGDGFVVLVNDFRELWWVNNQAVRVVEE